MVGIEASVEGNIGEEAAEEGSIVEEEEDSIQAEAGEVADIVS